MVSMAYPHPRSRNSCHADEPTTNHEEVQLIESRMQLRLEVLRVDCAGATSNDTLLVTIADFAIIIKHV